jgi:hypothetical protein
MRLIAASIAFEANWGADKEESDPPKLPIGVRTAEMIYTSCMIYNLND